MKSVTHKAIFMSIEAEVKVEVKAEKDNLLTLNLNLNLWIYFTIIILLLPLKLLYNQTTMLTKYNLSGRFLLLCKRIWIFSPCQNHVSMRKLFLVLALVLKAVVFQGQDSVAFEPAGSPVLRVFSNFVAPLGGEDQKTSFELRRAYMGYRYQLYEEWEAAIVLDIGSPNDDSPYSLLKRYAYFKIASLTYNRNNLRIQAGIIPRYSMQAPEKFWGRRYIEKVFLDAYRFAPTADIGVGMDYTINKKLSVYTALMNGEGYDQLQHDNTYELSVGVNYLPLEWLFFRMNLDYSKKAVTETMSSFFTGLRFNNDYVFGAELNWIHNEGFEQGTERYGYSVFGHRTWRKKYAVFLRYDWLQSNIPDGYNHPWNLAKDGSALIYGLEYYPKPKIHLSLNYQDWFPAANDLQNSKGLYINLEFRL